MIAAETIRAMVLRRCIDHSNREALRNAVTLTLFELVQRGELTVVDLCAMAAHAIVFGKTADS